MILTIDDERDLLSIDRRLLERAAEITLGTEAVGADSAEISLSVLLPEEIHALNREHRGIDAPTDVLSFPQYEGSFEIREAAESGRPVLLGDVLLNMSAIAKQAAEYGHSEERETAYLFVHGVLHLLGHDHEAGADRAVMREAEEFVLSMIGLGISDKDRSEGKGVEGKL